MRRAFTLIELLVVVAIIGILAAIAVPNFLNAQIRAKVARAVSNMRTIGTALEAYYLDNNSYTRWAWDSDGYQGFKALTTPIAYVTSDSVFMNPFKAASDKRKYVSSCAELDPKFELGTWFARSGTEFIIQFQYP